MVTIDHSPLSSEKGVLGGTLVFRGSRVPAQTLIDYLNDGYSLDQFLEFFPSVQKEEAKAFMQLIESGQNDSHL
jgi:uncharacterized protein (DUF433 family)